MTGYMIGGKKTNPSVQDGKLHVRETGLGTVISNLCRQLGGQANDYMMLSLGSPVQGERILAGAGNDNILGRTLD